LCALHVQYRKRAFNGLRLHVVRLSVLRNIGGSGLHRLAILEANCTINLPTTFALRSPKAIHILPMEHGESRGE